MTSSPGSVTILEPVSPSSYAVPEPSGSVFHPVNVCAKRVKALAGSLADVPNT